LHRESIETKREERDILTSVNARAIWDSYTASWSATEDESRLALFRDCLTDDCVYKDPNIETHGYEELAAYMTGLQQQIPGAGFVTREFVSHHDSALIRWNMVDGSGTVINPGTSIGVFSKDGRLKSRTSHRLDPWGRDAISVDWPCSSS